MATSSKLPWYRSAELGHRRAALSVGVATFTWILIQLSPAGLWLNTQLSHPLLFGARHKLGRDPKLDPNLRLYLYDDATLKGVQRSDLTLTEWAALLETLREASPRRVLFDKMFGTPLGIETAASFSTRLKSLPFPVTATAFVSPQPVVHGTAVDPSEADYHIPLEAIPHTRVSVQGGFVYGPAGSVQSAFRHVGHAGYEADTRVRLWHRLSATDGVPHAALFAADRIEWTQGRLSLDGKPIPSDSQSRIWVNLAHPSVYADPSRSFRIAGLLALAKQNKQSQKVTREATVLLLPAMFTGGTEQVPTPYGAMPSGYVLAALVNSVLTGAWLGEFPYGWSITFLLGLLGGWFGMTFSTRSFWLGSVGMTLAIAVSALAAFSYGSLIVPWIPWMGAFLSSATIIHAQRSRNAEKRSSRLKDLLEGTIPSARLRSILANPDRLTLEPAIRTVTVVFLDIVGFSLAAEKLHPDASFGHLKALLERLTGTILKHGGIVDRTLGDGVLAFFGYDFDGVEINPDHADRAVLCGLEIQQRNVDQNLEAAARGEPIFPIRIGINTGQVHIGDIGNHHRIDLTLIGTEVNLAKRLETSCEIHTLLIGRETKHLLSPAALTNLQIWRRDIQIKHHSELIEAYEVLPRESATRRESALAAYWQFAGIQSREARNGLINEKPLTVRLPEAEGILTNYSLSGFGMELNKYLGVGVQQLATLGDENSPFQKELQAAGLLPLLVEVRWGKALSENRFLHGIQIKNLTAPQREAFLTVMTRWSHLSARAA